MHRVFVYGTLKMGEPNHHWLTDKNNGHSEFIGAAHTMEKYPLIIATQYNIPFLLYSPGTGNEVQGEIYEVDEKMLLKLDELEDHPNFYVRELHHVILNKNTEKETEIECWIYFIKTFKSELLENQQFSCYSSKGEHGFEYVIRSNRDPTYLSSWKNEYIFNK